MMMWKLLTYELLYRRTLLLVILGLILSMAIVYVRFSHLEPGMSGWAFRIMIILCIGLVWLVRLSEMQKEKSDRIMRLLPVKTVTVGISRILFLFIPWLLLIVFYCSADVIVSGGGQMAGNIVSSLSFTALFLLANSLTLINHDHRFCGMYKPLQATITTILSTIMFGGYIIFVLTGSLGRELGVYVENISARLVHFYNSGSGVFTLVAAGVVLTIISVMTYNKRVTYVE